jgi:L-2,4-diaminobutyric acid acetyltransferase
MAHPIDNRAYRLATPRPEQGAAIHALVDACKPLDLNSTYAYLLLCHHFAGTCVVCMNNDEPVGFVSAYIPPEASTTVFVWQVAVHPDHRGRALGGAMLEELLARSALRDVSVLETTVSPSNAASTSMFKKLALAMGAQISERTLFLAQHFDGENHEEEVLLRISPLKKLFTATNSTRRAHDIANI